jgi:hypothetical protein
LMQALGRALDGLGAAVCIDETGENLVRTLRGPRAVEIPPRRPYVGPPVVEVWARGLPNLLHEFVHLILSARLDDDHGIDYGRIPFDLDTPSGRAVLFEELACCVLSCAYLSVDETVATCRRVDEWFVEQVEIQPVFYGMEDEPQRFWTCLEQTTHVHHLAFGRVLRRAYEDAAAVLAWAGASPSVSRAPRALTFAELLRRMRAHDTGRGAHDVI